jgi:hypothetical protein
MSGAFAFCPEIRISGLHTNAISRIAVRHSLFYPSNRSNAWRLIPSAMSSNAAVKVINESTSSLRFQEASNLGLNKSCKNKVRVCIKISYDGLFGFALNFII